MARHITARQRTILEYIIQCIRDNGCPPTVAEIRDTFGMASSNGAHDALVALERKGYIERSSKARGIRVTETAGTGLYQSEVGALPLVGRVAAGYPILAEENIEGQVAVSASLANGQAYCLRVTGDSMVEDGILDGDVLIVDQARTPRRGDVVVALVEDEATVKHYYPFGAEVELRPANASMRPMRYPSKAVALQGVVVGLQRTLLN